MANYFFDQEFNLIVVHYLTVALGLAMFTIIFVAFLMSISSDYHSPNDLLFLFVMSFLATVSIIVKVVFYHVEDRLKLSNFEGVTVEIPRKKDEKFEKQDGDLKTKHFHEIIV
jgi:hypothetical protein